MERISKHQSHTYCHKIGSDQFNGSDKMKGDGGGGKLRPRREGGEGEEKRGKINGESGGDTLRSRRKEEEEEGEGKRGIES